MINWILFYFFNHCLRKRDLGTYFLTKQILFIQTHKTLLLFIPILNDPKQTFKIHFGNYKVEKGKISLIYDHSNLIYQQNQFLILIINKQLMYSRHFEYSEPATRARELCLIENEQKDAVISTLKAELFPLRNLELEFHQLNDQISFLQERYSLLIAERDHAEREQRAKSDLDRNAIIQLKAELDVLRGQLQRIAVDIEESSRENVALKRMCEARGNEIQGLLNQQNDLDHKNQRQLQDNKTLGANIKNLKDQRKKLEDDCDALSSFLEQNINRLKGIERNVRNAESQNARFEKTLGQAENDHEKLQHQLKTKSEELRRAQAKDKQTNLTLQQLKGVVNNLISQLDKNKLELAKTEGLLQNEATKGKQLLGKIGSIEVSLRERQDQLQKIGWEENKIRNQHMQRLQDNKILNSQIDRLLAIIHEYQLVNSQLLDEIELYIEQDQQARNILDRREQMRELSQKVLLKINTTGQPIRHLKTIFNH